MKRPLAATAILAITAALTVGSANALPVQNLQVERPDAESHVLDVKYYKKKSHYKLGPRQIRRSLRHRGFSQVRIVKLRKKSAVAIAHGRRGIVRLAVSRHTGEIISRKLIKPYRGYRHHYRGGRYYNNGAWSLEYRF